MCRVCTNHDHDMQNQTANDGECAGETTAGIVRMYMLGAECLAMKDGTSKTHTPQS